VRDINGATQMLKAVVLDRMVSLPTPACVIVSVRLSMARKDAHSTLMGPSNLQVRAARFY